MIIVEMICVLIYSSLTYLPFDATLWEGCLLRCPLKVQAVALHYCTIALYCHQWLFVLLRAAGRALPHDRLKFVFWESHARPNSHVICRGLNANAHWSSMMFSVLFGEAWGQWVRAGGFGNCCTRQLAQMWLRWCGLYLALSVALHIYHGCPFCHSARWHLLCRRWCRTRLHLGGRSKCQNEFRDVWIPSIFCFRVAHVANPDARRCISCFHGTTKHFHPIQ